MLQPYSEWNNKMTEPSRSIYGEVELLGSTPTIYKPEGQLINIKWEKTPATGKLFGYSIAQKATVELLNVNDDINVSKGDKFVVRLGATFDKTKLVQSPIFEVNEIEYEKVKKTVKIVGYDTIFEAQNHTVSEINMVSNLFSESIMIGYIAEALGIEADLTYSQSVVSFNIDKEKINWNGDETIRSAIDMLAEVTGTIAYITNENKLIFKPLSKDSQLTITENDYFDFTWNNGKRLTKLVNADEFSDNISVGNDDGFIQTFYDNCFLELLIDTRISGQLQNIFDKYENYYYVPYKLKWRGNPGLEIGDYISVQKNDTVYLVYFTGETLEYNGGLSSNIEVLDTPFEKVQSNPSTLGEALNKTTAKVDKTNKRIDLTVEDVNTNKQLISNLSVKSDGISSTVSSNKTYVDEQLKKTNDALAQQNTDLNEKITQVNNTVSARMDDESIKYEISQAVSTGTAAAVKTTEGFTFDENGLTVENSGKDFKTLITNDGMYIKKNNNTVLSATHDGVDAENLHATTYLIIGNNSRLEDAGNRTACYWIRN